MPEVHAAVFNTPITPSTPFTLVAINPGSSSIKLGVFSVDGGRAASIGRATLDLSHGQPAIRFEGGTTGDAERASVHGSDDIEQVIDETLQRLARHFSLPDFAVAAHRVVHGGDRFAGAAWIDDASIASIEALSPLAPLHQPQSLRLIHALRKKRPALLQTASFDTAFHRSQSPVVRRFALPRELFDEGIRRYGFHGLSYKSIAGQLKHRHPALSEGKLVVAHLGSGASLCGLQGGQSQDTSMAFSTLDGIPMATRPGAVDAGVLLYLLKARAMPVGELEEMLYHRSGLLGMSGISGDVNVLMASEAPAAREAIEIMALRVAREVAAIATTLGGLDGIVFTGGVGQHQPKLREAIVQRLAWLGAHIDVAANLASLANLAHTSLVNTPSSRVALAVMATDEEQVMADEACELLSTHDAGEPA